MAQYKKNRKRLCLQCKSNLGSSKNHNEIQNNPANNNTINVNPNINVSVNGQAVNQCECSGTVNFQDPDQGFSFTANICPGCSLEGSFISLIVRDFFSFISNRVNPPICISTEQVTVLTVSAHGTLTNSQTLSSVLTLTLIELPDGDDIVVLETTGIDDGAIFIFIFSFTVPDGDLTIRSCSQSSQTSPLIFDEVEIRNLRNSIGRGRITIIRNGEVENRDL